MSELLERMATATTGWIVEPTRLRLVRPVESVEAWSDIGRALAARARATCWAQGDWLLLGGREVDGKGTRWNGSGYARAAQITGHSPSHLSNLFRVAEAFEPDARVPELSWTLHRETLRVPADQRAGLLRQALRRGWSSEDLVLHLEAARQAATRADAPPRSTPDPARAPRSFYVSPKVRCPKCSHTFPIKGHKV